MKELFDPQIDKKIIEALNIHNFIDELNTLYKKTKNFLNDNQFCVEIKSNPNTFHQRWFEMHLIGKLLAADIVLIPCKNDGQPDIKVQLSSGNSMWIECTAPTPGEHKENLTIKYGEDAQETPFEYILPRITQAVSEKIEQDDGRMKNQLFQPNDIRFLIINCALFSNFLHDKFVGLFEGFDQIWFDFDTKTLATSHSEFIKKPKSNASINIGYIKNPNFPFDIVMLSSEKLGAVSNTPEYSRPLFKNTFQPTDEISRIIKIIFTK